VFLGVGWAAVPIDLINSWRNRPKKMHIDTYNRKKMELLKYILRLRTMGKDLVKRKPKVELEQGCKLQP
jgi:hypothetical protein